MTMDARWWFNGRLYASLGVLYYRWDVEVRKWELVG